MRRSRRRAAGEHFVLGLLLVAALILLVALWRLVLSFSAMPPAVAAHASLMLVAWGLLLPVGAVLARYFKVMPRQDFPAVLDNRAWFNWHRVFQYAGLVLATVGLAVILIETAGRVDSWHGRCGLAAMALGWGQVVSTWFRGTHGGPTGKTARPDDPSTWRGDHYDMTNRRVLFEAWHKRVGWITILLAEVVVLLGLALAAAPGWLFAVAGALHAAFALAVIDSRLHGRWVATYVALWGLDPIHPGTRRRGDLPPWSKRRNHRAANRR